jgi:hypothetical protein
MESQRSIEATGRRRLMGWVFARSVLQVVTAMALVAVIGAVAAPRAAEASTTTGYRLLGGDGGVFAFSSPFFGSAGSDTSLCPPNTRDRIMPNGTCWAMASTPGGGGYWILNAYTGAITTYGNAVSYGDRTQFNGGGADTWPNSIGIVATPDGKGYWVLEAGMSGLGSVDHFGDAVSYGDQTTVAHEAVHVGVPVSMASSPDGKGYWIVNSDGGVFAFGDAGFFGSMGGAHLNAGVVGIARTTDGKGYWLAASDGGVFAFGDAAFGGSMAGSPLNEPVAGIAADPAGPGYWLAATDGGVFALGGAPFLGSMGGVRLQQAVFAISVRAAAG